MIPDYVEEFEEEAQTKWADQYMEAREKGHDPEESIAEANEWYVGWKERKQKQHTHTEKVPMHMLEEDGELLKRDDSGEVYFDAILGGTQRHKDGLRFSEDVLKKWKDEINNGNFAGDIDHAMFDKMKKKTSDIDAITSMLKAKPGITKDIQAFMEDGVLKIRGWLDKRYEKILKKARGVSLESFITRDEETDTVVDGDFLGITFNVNTEPAVTNAKITKIGDKDE